MTAEIIKDKKRVYKEILKQGKFKSWITEDDIKEAIHALSNGHEIATTRHKLGGTGGWLDRWGGVQSEVADEICNLPEARRAIALIQKYFPKKQY